MAHLFCRFIFLHYLCTIKHRGIEQLVARQAHNLKVVWFESHSRYTVRTNRKISPFFCFVGTRTTGSDNPSSESRGVLARAMPSRVGLKTSEAQSIPLPLLSQKKEYLVYSFFCFNSMMWGERTTFYAKKRADNRSALFVFYHCHVEVLSRSLVPSER